MWRRPWEALTHAFVLGALITQCFLAKRPKLGVLLFTCHCMWIACKVIGAKREGIRLPQLFNGVAFAVWSVFYFLSVAIGGSLSNFRPDSVANIILSTLAAVFWFHNVFYTQMLGAGDFSKLKFDGPYKVGVRYFHFAGKDVEAMCYYPIDEDEYARKIKSHNAPWMFRRDETTKGMQTVYKQWFGIDLPHFLIRPQHVIKIDAIIDGRLARDFRGGEKQLRPVLFSHGLFAQKVHYSGLHKDLASHGYIVFSINHGDGSCMHTQNS